MTIFDLIATVAFCALLAIGLLWPWFDDDKDIPWQD